MLWGAPGSEDSVWKSVLSLHPTREGLLFLLRYGLQPRWPVSVWDSLVSTLLLMVGALGFQLLPVSLGFLRWIYGIELGSPYTVCYLLSHLCGSASISLRQGLSMLEENWSHLLESEDFCWL